MKQSLRLRTSQHLASTPQLQQSIRLLQLFTLELHQELEQTLSYNPLLKRVVDPLDNSVRLLVDGAISGTTPIMNALVDDNEVSSYSAEVEAAFEPPAANDNTPENSEGEWIFEDVSRTPKLPTMKTHGLSWKRTNRRYTSTCCSDERNPQGPCTTARWSNWRSMSLTTTAIWKRCLRKSVYASARRAGNRN